MVVGAIVLGVAGLYAWMTSEFTDCFANFESLEAAEQVALTARFAGFDGFEVEDAGPGARDHESQGGGNISVTITTGESGSEATPLQLSFRRLVRAQDGNFGHPDGGCLAKTYYD